MMEGLGADETNPVVADINQGARKKTKGKRRTALERENRYCILLVLYNKGFAVINVYLGAR